MTRSELYSQIRCLEEVVNTLNYKFDEDIDEDNPNEIVIWDEETERAFVVLGKVYARLIGA